MPEDEKITIVGFPSTGLVGAFAVSYIVKSLKMKRIGELEAFEISPSVRIQNGNVYGPFQIYNKDNIYVILSNIPLFSESAFIFVKSVIEYCKKINVDKIIIPRGMIVMGPEENPPASFGLTVNEISKKMLQEYNLSVITDASIVGADAGVISALKKSDIPNLILYTICNMKFPDSNAIVKAIETLAKIINVKIDTLKFEENLEQISKDNERLIEQTKKSLEKPNEASPSMPSPGIG
ncbi:MAG: PAC2 family protein [Nitrosopumilus sp.]|nr:PAC2 family protein [Nitrosopumilus sp.]